MPDTTTALQHTPGHRSRWPTTLLGAGLPLLTSIVLTSAVSLQLGPQQEELVEQRLREALTHSSTNIPSVEVLLITPQTAPDSVFSDSASTTARWLDGKWYISTAQRTPNGWQAARQTLDSAYSPVKSLQWVLLLCTLPLSLLGGIFGWRLGKREP